MSGPADQFPVSISLALKAGVLPGATCGGVTPLFWSKKLFLGTRWHMPQVKPRLSLWKPCCAYLTRSKGIDEGRASWTEKNSAIVLRGDSEYHLFLLAPLIWEQYTAWKIHIILIHSEHIHMRIPASQNLFAHTRVYKSLCLTNSSCSSETFCSLASVKTCNFIFRSCSHFWKSNKVLGFSGIKCP